MFTIRHKSRHQYIYFDGGFAEFDKKPRKSATRDSKEKVLPLYNKAMDQLAAVNNKSIEEMSKEFTIVDLTVHPAPRG